MSVNIVNSVVNLQTYSNGYDTNVKSTQDTDSAAKTTDGVVYETSDSSDNTATYSVNKMSSSDRKALVSQLKADAEARQSQFTNLIYQMMNQQTNAYGKANNIWQFLASGNYTVDPATKAQAQADIAEDGYYGVSQTSSRIFDFACALAGNDADKMKEMQEAFTKGFKQAEKTWGGKLPDISYETQEAVNKKFEEYFASMGA